MIDAYGIKWKTDDPVIPELRMYSETDEFRAKVPGALSRSEHFAKAIRLLLPEGSGLEWHSWVERAIENWCERDIHSWWGPSSAGKSSLAGLLFYVDLLADPTGTLTVFITDKLENHAKRCWKEVLYWRSKMPKKWQVGKIYNSTQARKLVIGDGATAAGIFCTSTADGDSEKDLKDKLGGHNRRQRLCVDEAQACGISVLKIKMNLGATGKGWAFYKEIFIGNPDSWSNALGVHSEPMDGDREKTTKQHVTEWDTTQIWHDVPGRAMVFDSRNSPAFDSPREAKRLFFLPNQATVENYRSQAGGEDAPSFWTYAIGRIPPAGGKPVLLSEADAKAVNATQQRPWADSKPRERWIGVDTSQGGDGVALTPVEIGEARDGLDKYTTGAAGGKRRALVQCGEIRYANPNMSEPDKSGQIAHKIIAIVNELRIPWDQVAISQGGQEAAIIDTIERTVPCHGKIHRITPGGPASERPTGKAVKRMNAKGREENVQEVARDRIETRAAELALNAAQLVAQGSVCKVPQLIIDQMMSRGVILGQGKTNIQDKKSWKKDNNGRSPDELDAFAVVMDVLLAKGKLRLGEQVLKAEQSTPYGEDWMNPRAKGFGISEHMKTIRDLCRS